MRAANFLAAMLAFGAWARAGTVEAPLDVRRTAAATFTQPPKVEKVGAQWRISFALSAATDVAVAVLDKDGRVVRHLAAGLLGPHAPAPFKKDSLAQQILWDGRSDDGRMVLADASRAPLKVRVSGGLSASLAGTAFGSDARPNHLTNVIGLATGPDGRVYVLSERWTRAWWRGTAIHVFKRTGEYEKTIKPFPASLAAERVAGLTALRDEQARPVPVIYRVLAMSYYPKEDLPQQMAVTPDGRVHFLVLHAGYHKDQGPRKWLASLGPDGGLAYANYTGGEIKGETAAGHVHLAASSDGTAIFATGINRGPGESSRTRPNVGAVYSVDLPERTGARVFFGDPATPGGDEKHLSDPRGLATDGRGHLFVADRGNNRLAILDEKAGTLTSSVPVPAPTWVGVNRRSGAVYVVSGAEVIKFARAGDTFAERARVRLPEVRDRNASLVRWSFALDAQAGATVLWVGLSRGERVLMRCQEKGDTFGPWQQAGYQPAPAYWNIAAGQDGRTVTCKIDSRTLRLLDEETGQTRDLRLQDSGGQTYRLGPNGQIYGMDHGGIGIMRWDRNGRPLPFAASGRRLPNRPSGTTCWERDFDVDRAGHIYVKQRGKHYHGRMRVDKYDRDGNFLGTLIWVVSDGALGPRLDAAGNLYIAEAVKPVGQAVPEFFRGRLPDAPIDSKGNVERQYWWMYGSIIKFPPAGGAVWFPVSADTDAYAFDGQARLPADQAKVKIDVPLGGGGSRTRIRPGELQGAAWFRFGCSYVLDMHPGHNRRCHCTATEFDVDPYGRVFYTDQGRFRVVVLDTNGNELLTFGRYGNQDSVGPEVAFNWFTGLGVTDGHVYVADGLNRRVVKVRLNAAAEETCTLP